MITPYNQFAIDGEQKRKEAALKRMIDALPDSIEYRFKIWYNNTKGMEKSRFVDVRIRPKRGETLETATAYLPKTLKKGEKYIICEKKEEKHIYNSKINNP